MTSSGERNHTEEETSEYVLREGDRVLTLDNNRSVATFIVEHLKPFLENFNRDFPWVTLDNVSASETIARCYDTFHANVTKAKNSIVDFDDIERAICQVKMSNKDTRWDEIAAILSISKWLWKPVYENATGREIKKGPYNVIVHPRPELLEEISAHASDSKKEKITLSLEKRIVRLERLICAGLESERMESDLND